MTDKSQSSSNEIEQLAREIAHKLGLEGYEAYFSGGCVRDMILGREPLDYDIATSAPPDVTQSLYPNSLTVGKCFGVVTVVRNGLEVEVATFRQDIQYTDGRHPDKVLLSSSKEEDVKRRDFTINGLLYDPSKPFNIDNVIDLVDGKEDIKRKIIRTIGNPDERFSEDKLRMMRAVRFACQLDFIIDNDTETSIIKNAEGIRIISKERIRNELEKILISSKRSFGIKKLHELQLLKHILPEVCDMVDVQQPPNFHPEGDVFTHTLLCLDALEDIGKDDFPLVMGTLLHDVGKPKTFERTPDRIRFTNHDIVGRDIAEDICNRLKLSNNEKEKILFLVERHLIFKDAVAMKESTLKRLLLNPFFADLQRLHKADRLASDKDLTLYYFCKEKYDDFLAEKPPPKPLIMGKDLIELGLEPGPIFGKILAEIEDAQLENTVTTKEDALLLAVKLLKEKYNIQVTGKSPYQ